MEDINNEADGPEKVELTHEESLLPKDQKKTIVIDKKLVNERKFWNVRMKNLVVKLRHVTDVSDAQVLMLSYRHMLVDKIIELKRLIGKQKASYWTVHKEAFIKYKSGTGGVQLKLNAGEINEFIKADKKEKLSQIDLLEGQAQYYQGTIDTLDKMGFAIKNKLTLEQSF